MTTTEKNLKEAFAGESQASQKYLAFARKAEREGLHNIARLFRTTAAAETLHALGHLEALGGVGSTAGNLQAAIAGETMEYSEMYPPMLAQAEKEKHQARRMFSYATEAEAVHARLFRSALEAAVAGNDLDVSEFFLCPVCGHIELGEPPSTCPICGVKAAKYVQIP